MGEPVSSRFIPYLECLAPGGREQVLSYLRMIKARAYTPDTLRHAATALKLFVSRLPDGRRVVVAGDLALAEPRDIDSSVEAEQSRGLSPVTINGRLSQLREFFHFLIEEGVMARHPVSRRRHHLAVSEILPRPCPTLTWCDSSRPWTRCATASYSY